MVTEQLLKKTSFGRFRFLWQWLLIPIKTMHQTIRTAVVSYALNLRIDAYLKNYLKHMSQFLDPLNFATFLNSRFFDVGSVLFQKIILRRHF